MRINRIAAIFTSTLLFFLQISFAQTAVDSKSEIYSKLKCCECSVSFDKCVCPEAKEMKAYIEALLGNNASKDDIFYKVAKKFTLDTILDEKIRNAVQERIIKEAGKMRPQIVLEPQAFNLGKVSKKQGRASKIFKLSNKGNSDLIITNIRVSCSCVTASLSVGNNKSPYFGMAGSNTGWQQIIKPGKSGELEVVLDLAHTSMADGKQIRDIFVASNDPVYPQVTIKYSIELKRF